MKGSGRHLLDVLLVDDDGAKLSLDLDEAVADLRKRTSCYSELVAVPVGRLDFLPYEFIKHAHGRFGACWFIIFDDWLIIGCGKYAHLNPCYEGLLGAIFSMFFSLMMMVPRFPLILTKPLLICVSVPLAIRNWLPSL